MPRILVTYATLAGSTREVATVVGEEIAKNNLQVDVLPLHEVKSLADYAGVVVGGPMIVGWHREALSFLKRQRAALRRIPLGIFVLAMSVTQTGETSVGGMPICLDEKLPQPPEKPGTLNFRERYAQLGRYIQPILNAIQPVKPASLAVFGGRVEYGRLPWWGVLFAMVVIRAPAGDKRNWPLIRQWAACLPDAFKLTVEVESKTTPTPDLTALRPLPSAALPPPLAQYHES